MTNSNLKSNYAHTDGSPYTGCYTVLFRHEMYNNFFAQTHNKYKRTPPSESVVSDMTHVNALLVAPMQCEVFLI